MRKGTNKKKKINKWKCIQNVYSCTHFFSRNIHIYIYIYTAEGLRYFCTFVDVGDTQGWKISRGRKCWIITKNYQKNGSNEGRSRALKLPINCFIYSPIVCINAVTSMRREWTGETILHDCVVFLRRVTLPFNIRVVNTYRPRWVLVRFCSRGRVCRTGVGFAGSFASLRVSGYLLRSDNSIARCKTFGFSLPRLPFFLSLHVHTFRSGVIIAARKVDDETSRDVKNAIARAIVLRYLK